MSLPPPVMPPPPPVTGALDGTAVSVTVAGAVTVAVAVAVAVAVCVTVAVPDDGGDGDAEVAVAVPDVCINAAVDGVGLEPAAPDSVAACAAVPVSAIAAVPMARKPDARLIRIAISRSCSLDRLVMIMSNTDQIGDRSVDH
jgi:hypothetical protein